MFFYLRAKVREIEEMTDSGERREVTEYFYKRIRR